MTDVFCAKELIGLPGMPTTVRGIRITAQRKGWPSEDRPVRGGREKFYPLSTLPEKTQAHLLSIYKEKDDAQPDRADGLCLDDAAGANSPSDADDMLCSNDFGLIGEPSPPEQQPASAVAKPKREPSANGRPKGAKRNAKMDAWLAIIAEWERYKKLLNELSVVQREYAFEAAYNRQEIDVQPEVYETIAKISRATLCRQRIILAKNGVTALAGKEGAGRPK